MIKTFTDWVYSITGLEVAWQSRIFSSILIILVIWMIRSILIRIIWRITEDVHVRYRWRKIIGYTSTIFTILLLLPLWVSTGQSIVTIFGFLTAGVAIALQDIIKSLAGWMFILWRRPFKVGDRIEIKNIKGDVIDIRPFQFSLMEIGNRVDSEQSTGRVVHVPNSIVLSDYIANFGQGFKFIWNEIPVLITFESNWQKAKDILLGISKKHGEHLSKQAENRLKEASKEYMIFYNKLTPTVYTSVKDCGILLTLRYLTEPRHRRGSEHAVWEEVLISFMEQDDIDFAYPTTRFYNNDVEGKPSLQSKKE